MNKNIFRITSDIVEVCNLRCKYCYVEHQRPGFMSLETARNIFKLAQKKISEGYLVQVDLFGGEPLLVWEESLKPIIKLFSELYDVNDHTFRATIFTNATLLTEEILKFTKQFPFIQYNFSLDGIKKTHDRNRVYADSSGTYDDVQRGIDLYCKIYDRPRDSVIPKFMISPDVLDDLLDVCKESLQKGITALDFALVRDNIWEGYEEKFEKKMMEVADFYIRNIDKELSYYLLLFPIIDYNFRKSFYCTIGRIGVGIAPNGDIYPCQRFYNNKSPFKLGNINEGFYDNAHTRFFSSYSIQQFIGCKDCDTFKNFNCLGQCMASMWEASGQLLKPIPCVCTILKSLYKVSKYIYDNLKDNPHYQSLLDPSKYGG